MRKNIFIISFLFSISSYSQFYPADNGVNHFINAIYCINKDTVFAVGYSNSIYKTTNGGTSWNLQFSTPSQFPETQAFRSVFFLNKDTGFVVGSDTSNKGIIYKTTNGGQNWNLNFDTLGIFTSINFISNEIGFAVDMNVVYKTIDGGNNWFLLPQSFNNVNYYSKIQFLNDSTGYLGTSGRLYKTTNGGITWIPIPDFETAYNTLYFINPDTGFVSYTYGVRRTLDGDASFTETEYWCTPTAIYFPSDLIGYIVNYDALNSCSFVVKTSDMGNTWNNVTGYFASEYYYDVFFVNDSIGYIAGTGIKKTINGGHITNTNKILLGKNNLVIFQQGDELVIDFSSNGEDPFTIEIYDYSGKILLIKEYNALDNFVHIKSIFFQSSIYLCRIKNNNQYFSKKFLFLN
ncbi:MAG TPA: hypothetical protein DEH02_18655 [Bacteroidales bacterium]|nr:MAG: hypothetical protein A2X01_18845 [Bacteroidetes bacterium GWF2_35_48]OFY98538.1 MAG: hypothetical protein A2491_10255 [Bacteroidetes bacterium RIFOXYC12_FULL_35_7]HBX53089.1 hypothetical protein [Bacteroidales bacterium]